MVEIDGDIPCCEIKSTSCRILSKDHRKTHIFSKDGGENVNFVKGSLKITNFI